MDAELAVKQGRCSSTSLISMDGVYADICLEQMRW